MMSSSISAIAPVAVLLWYRHLTDAPGTPKWTLGVQFRSQIQAA
jgi:hypothetical protein